jgi:hypothetical protein
MSRPSRPTVYLIAQPSISRSKKPIDISPLYEHGDVKVVLPMGDSPTNRPSESYCIMEDRLATFDPDRDFLVWASGDVLSAVMTGMILTNMEEPIWKFNWLRYERARDSDGSRSHVGAKYVPVVIDLEEPQLELLAGDTYVDDHEDYDDDQEEVTA